RPAERIPDLAIDIRDRPARSEQPGGHLRSEAEDRARAQARGRARPATKNGGQVQKRQGKEQNILRMNQRQNSSEKTQEEQARVGWTRIGLPDEQEERPQEDAAAVWIAGPDEGEEGERAGVEQCDLRRRGGGVGGDAPGEPVD